MIVDDLFESPQTCPECGGPAFSDLLLAEKKDACYHKVRSRYKVWPSAYASGALVQCRKKGAANWGNKSEGVEEGLGDYVGRKLQVKTTKGKPDFKNAPQWATALGQTPQGAWHWLEKDGPTEIPDSDRYFPLSGKTEFTGFVSEYKGNQGVAEGPGFDKWADERAASQLHKLNIPKTWVLNVMDEATGEHWAIEIQATSPDMAKERAQQQGYKVLRIKEKVVAEDDAGDVEQRMIAKIEKEKQRLAKLKQTDPEAYKREMAKRKTSGRVPPVSTFEDQLDERCWDTHRQAGMKKKGDRMVPNCVPKEDVAETDNFRAPAAMMKASPEALSQAQNIVQQQADNNVIGQAKIAGAVPNQGVAETDKIGNMDADKFDDAMARLKQLAGQGPRKTVWDPVKRVYKTVPVNPQPK